MRRQEPFTGDWGVGANGPEMGPDEEDYLRHEAEMERRHGGDETEEPWMGYTPGEDAPDRRQPGARKGVL